MIVICQKSVFSRTGRRIHNQKAFRVVQWLWLCALNAGVQGSISSQTRSHRPELKSLHGATKSWCSQVLVGTKLITVSHCWIPCHLILEKFLSKCDYVTHHLHISWVFIIFANKLLLVNCMYFRLRKLLLDKKRIHTQFSYWVQNGS